MARIMPGTGDPLARWASHSPQPPNAARCRACSRHRRRRAARGRPALPGTLKCRRHVEPASWSMRAFLRRAWACPGSRPARCWLHASLAQGAVWFGSLGPPRSGVRGGAPLDARPGRCRVAMPCRRQCLARRARPKVPRSPRFTPCAQAQEFAGPACTTNNPPPPFRSPDRLLDPFSAHRLRFLEGCARGIPSELASLEAKAARVAACWGPHHPQSRRAHQLLHHAYAQHGASEFFACRAAAALARCRGRGSTGWGLRGSAVARRAWRNEPRPCAGLQNARQGIFLSLAIQADAMLDGWACMHPRTGLGCRPRSPLPPGLPAQGACRTPAVNRRRGVAHVAPPVPGIQSLGQKGVRRGMPITPSRTRPGGEALHGPSTGRAAGNPSLAPGRAAWSWTQQHALTHKHNRMVRKHVTKS